MSYAASRHGRNHATPSHEAVPEPHRTRTESPAEQQAEFHHCARGAQLGSVWLNDIGDQPNFTGAQHGISVAYRNGADGTLDHSQVYDYQKGGVLADGAGTNAQVLSNVVRGQGPTPLIAQNGVQYSRNATGHINDNFIQDHRYTGCTKQQQRAGTCTFVVATGILLFSVDPSLVDTKNNTFRNNDANLVNASNL
jgi:hypothetical protein